MNSFKQYSTSLLSKSSPPKCKSPFIANTSIVCSKIVDIEILKVPPPKSNISIFSSSLSSELKILFKQQARLAAVD